MTRNNSTRSLVILGLMTAILIVFSFTPIGTIPIGPLSITLNIIPIAIAAAALGPAGGAAMGAVFGLLSFLQCLGIGIPSGMGATPSGTRCPITARPPARPGTAPRSAAYKPAGFITGFFSAFLNTLFFMSALILLFGNTEYVQGLMGGKNVIAFVCAFVGVNAVFEMIVSTVVTGGVVLALYKAKLLPIAKKA